MAKKKTSIVVAEASDIASYDVFEDMDEIRALMEANIGQTTELNEFSLPRAVNAATSNRWEIPGLGDEPEVTSEVEGIIVAHSPARARYIESYDTTGGGAPDCISKDGIHGIGSPGGLCVRCRYAQFTKRDDGSTESPECELAKRLFILRPGEIMPTMFNAKKGNVGQVETYFNNLTFKGRLKFNHCITKITVTKDKYKNNRDWMKWNLNLVSALPAEAKKQMDEFAESIRPIVQKIEIEASDVVEEIDAAFDDV